MRTLRLLTLTALLGLACSAPSLAHAQQPSCRTRCEPRELQDPYGCCVPSPTQSSALALPPELSSPSSPATTLRSYHLSAQAQALPERAELLEQLGALRGDEALEAAEARAEKAWALLMVLEEELLATSHACTGESWEGAELERCLGSAAPTLGQRSALLEVAVPAWEALAARDPQPEWRAQTRYYLATGLMMQGEHKRAVELLSALMQPEDAGPYGRLAMLGLADYFFERGSMELAIPLYLRAQSQQESAAMSAYGAYMEGWARAQTGDIELAMRALLRALDTTQRSPTMQARASLARALHADITLMYAHVGTPQNAGAFYEAVGVPRALLSVFLLRLGRAYEGLGKREEAIELYGAMTSSQQARERLAALLERN